VDPPIPSNETVSSTARKKPTPPPAKAASKSQSKNVVAPKKAKGKSVEKSAVTPSSPDEESLVGSAIPVEKGSAVLVPSGTMYDRTRSKRKAAVEQAKSKVNTYFFHILCHCLLYAYDRCLVSCTYLFPPSFPFFFFFFRPGERLVVRPRALIGLPLSSRWYHRPQSLLCLFLRKLNFFLFSFAGDQW
jgi:hypothetical protein